jgi:hypothetical protein
VETVRVEFPGGWADIRPADDLTGEDEVRVRQAVKLKGSSPRDRQQPGGEDEGDGFTATAASTALMEFAMLARVITSWSLPQPVNALSIQGLKLAQLRALRKAIVPHMEMLREDDPNSLSGSETASAS